MFKKYLNLLLAIVLSLVLIIGCSRSGENPVSVPNPLTDMPSVSQITESDDHMLLGTWDANFDLDSMTASVEPNRDTSIHFNVKPYLPNPGISINSWDPVREIIDVDVTINNVYNINAYDVRIIIFTDSAGHTLANADSWTGLYDIPDGMDMNPFVALAKGIPNRLFEGYSQHTVNLRIKLPGLNTNVAFAIDASFPGNCEEPYEINNFIQHEPLAGLNSTAQISFDVSSWNPSATNRAWIHCPSVFGTPAIEIPSVDNQFFSGDIVNNTGAMEGEYVAIIFAKTDQSNISLYKFANVTVVADMGTGWVVQIEDSSVVTVTADNAGNVYTAGSQFGELMKYNDEPVQQWARGIGTEDGFSLITNLHFENYIRVSGVNGFIGTAGPFGYAAGMYGSDNTRIWSDFDYEDPPSQIGVSILGDASGNSILSNAYLTGPIGPGTGMDSILKKKDINGDDIWSQNFENPEGSMTIWGLEFSESESILAAGYFQGTIVDFDPSAGEVLKSAPGASDGFLAEYTSDGLFSRLVTWGGESGIVEVQPMVVDSQENIYLMGRFVGEVDFDPGTNVVSLTSAPSGSTFISKFAPDFNFIDVIMVDIYPVTYWGSIAIDSNDNIYMAGSFTDTVDFDPGVSVEERTSVAGSDIFLLKLTKNLDFIWVRTWGSDAEDNAYDVACNQNTGSVYLVGFFQYTMDFDPGDGVYELTPPDNADSFILKVLPNGYWE